MGLVVLDGVGGWYCCDLCVLFEGDSMICFLLVILSWDDVEQVVLLCVIVLDCYFMGFEVEVFEWDFVCFIGSCFVVMVNLGFLVNLIMVVVLCYMQNFDLCLMFGDEVIVFVVSWFIIFFLLY